MNEKVTWDGARFRVREDILEVMRHTYPYFDRELQKATAWYLANPRKVKRQHFRFLVNWMNRNEDRQDLPKQESKPSNYEDPYKRANKEFDDQLKQWKADYEKENPSTP